MKNHDGQENLVMFPTGNYKGPKEKLQQKQVLDDPLEELLTEFDHLIDDDFVTRGFADESSESEALFQHLVDQARASLQADSEAEYIQEQLKTIKETQLRIKYFLTEIKNHI